MSYIYYKGIQRHTKNQRPPKKILDSTLHISNNTIFYVCEFTYHESYRYTTGINLGTLFEWQVALFPTGVIMASSCSPGWPPPLAGTAAAVFGAPFSTCAGCGSGVLATGGTGGVTGGVGVADDGVDDGVGVADDGVGVIEGGVAAILGGGVIGSGNGTTTTCLDAMASNSLIFWFARSNSSLSRWFGASGSPLVWGGLLAWAHSDGTGKVNVANSSMNICPYIQELAWIHERTGLLGWIFPNIG